MKLSSLFAKFLYQHKELRLPGIGVFTVDPSLPVPEFSDKNFNEFIQQIRYSQQPVTAADDAFINFIRTETGKIRPLAESDLDSYLSDGKIMLNIGKPFVVEGIGSLQKSREGNYVFTAGEPLLQRRESITHDNYEETSKNKSFFREDNQQSNNLKKLLLALGAISGIVLIVWFGYLLYNRNTGNSNTSGLDTALEDKVDSTSKANILLDSVQKIINAEKQALAGNPSTNDSRGTYKFIIERTANKARAFRRYQQIKENLTDIRMETKDSALFTLYFVLPALSSDTSRIKDSLRIWYGRRQVFIE